MGPAYTVALVGFTQSESATFESFFRLAARRPPAYVVQEEVLDAQLLLVNTDNPQAVALVRGAALPGRVLGIGAHDAGMGWPLERRPLRLVPLLASMDALVGQRAAPAARTRRRTPDTEFPATRPMARDEVLLMLARAGGVPATGVAEPRVAVPVRRMVSAPPPAPRSASAPPARRAAVRGHTDHAGLEDLLNLAPPARRSPASRLPPPAAKDLPAPNKPAHADALLVGQSLVEGRILLKRLRQFGLVVDWCREPVQAQAMLQAHAYRLVVIDRLGGMPDAFQVCRWAKQSPPAPEQRPKAQTPAPASAGSTVILFAPSAGSMERMKAGLAGADAYLSRSVSESDLYQVLAQHRLVSPRGFAPTDIAGF